MGLSVFADLSDGERGLILGSWIPSIPEGEMSPHATQKLTDAMWECSAPFASYVLNRVAAWLDGENRFTGDSVFEVTWSQAKTSAPVFSKLGRAKDTKRSCTVYRKDDGATWIVTWGRAEYRDVPEIVLSRIDPAGEKIDIVRGEITTGGPGSGNRHGFSNCPPPVTGTVEADIEYGGFEHLCTFCSAIRGSVPDELLKVVLREAVTFAHLPRLESLKPILDADGGLPGRLCEARHELVVQYATSSAAEWMLSQYQPLISGLRERGAEWGKAVISYNDSDYHCCVVEFSDGSVGLFSDNSATLADQRAYVARLEMEGERVKSVGVHVFHEDDDDYRVKIAAIGHGGARPDFAFDYEEEIASFPGGRYGWYGMTMFLWQSMADSTYALQDGKLDEGCWYWRPDAMDLTN